MGKVTTQLSVKTIFFLSKIGADRLSSLLINRVVNKKKSLVNIKQGTEIAKKTANSELLLTYCNDAIRLYPKNSFGYIEKARYLIASGSEKEAIALLKKAPKYSNITDLLNKTKSKNTKQISFESKNKEDLNFEIAVKNADGDDTLLKALENKARLKISQNPNVVSNYNILCQIIEKQGDYSELINILLMMPVNLKEKLDFQIMLANAYCKTSNHQLAYESLLKSQVSFPAERKILMRLSDLLKDDADISHSYSFLKAAKVCYPEYGLVKQLTFEIDHSFIEEAKNSIEEILHYPTTTFMKFLPMINRAIPFIGDKASEVKDKKIQSRQLLSSEKGRKGINPTTQVRVALKCRWLEEAKSIINRSRNGSQPVSEANQYWYNETLNRIGKYRKLFDLANFNEESKELYGFYNGKPTPCSLLDIPNENFVELFLPTVFLSDPADEKSSYKTVRSYFSNLFDILISRKDLVIVPRHQWNWRKCDPILPNARIVSYHTQDSFNSSHLHIQEAALAGKCTADFKGFAGYSNIAREFNEIEAYTKNINSDILRENSNYLYKKYVINNISKYEQNSDKVHIEGEYVFVALQIPTDIVASLAYIKGIDLVRAVADYYKDTSINVVVKRHPYCSSKTVEKTLKYLCDNKLITLSKASVHDLISGAQTVFTVNSGVGLESLLHKKPVVVTGECDYAYAVSAQVKNIPDLIDVLSRKLTFDESRANKFLYFYNKKYALNSDDFNGIENLINNWVSTK